MRRSEESVNATLENLTSKQYASKAHLENTFLVLFGWTRAGDEDIHQPFRALRPVRAGTHAAGDADERAEQVERLDVFAYIAALDRPLHQRVDRAADLSARTFVQLRGATSVGVQGRGDDVLGLDVIHEQQHPGPQSLQRRQRRGELPFRRRQLLYFGAVHRLDQGIARRKVAI